jgi:hypothetical protein
VDANMKMILGTMRGSKFRSNTYTPPLSGNNIFSRPPLRPYAYTANTLFALNHSPPLAYILLCYFHVFPITFLQGSIYWKIASPWGGISANVIWGKNVKREKMYEKKEERGKRKNGRKKKIKFKV